MQIWISVFAQWLAQQSDSLWEETISVLGGFGMQHSVTPTNQFVIQFFFVNLCQKMLCMMISQHLISTFYRQCGNMWSKSLPLVKNKSF